MRRERQSIRAMGVVLGRSPSTISREIRRNMSCYERSHGYYPVAAQKRYLSRIHQRRPGKHENGEVRQYVEEKLLLAWSPEQVAGRWKLEHKHEPSQWISHSTIYRWLHRGYVSQAAALQLRHKRHRNKPEARGRFNGVRTIQERSRQALKRTRLGDWEVDTIVSSHVHSKPCLLSLCDRKSRYCGIVLLRNRSAAEVMRGFEFFFNTSVLPLQTLTADRGKEFSCYQEVEDRWKIPFFFTNPHSPWQKPSIENLNGLVRQFFPKGTEFVEIPPDAVASVMHLLNHRPRKCLGFLSPYEVLHLP